MEFKVEVIIVPREGVLDTQGNAVEKTLANLGYRDLENVRVGRIINMNIKSESATEARKSAKAMCDDLLVNKLIETCKISIEEA